MGIVLSAAIVVGSEMVEGTSGTSETLYPLYQVEIAPIPVNISEDTAPEISSESVLVLDVPSASILYQNY